MLKPLRSFISQLHQKLLTHYCRQLVVLEGELDWTTMVASTFGESYQQKLWAGEYSADSFISCSFKQAKKWLGQEFDCVVVNAFSGIDADMLGALSGTIKGGGMLILMVPASSAQYSDSPFMQRLRRLFISSDVVTLRQPLNQHHCVIPSLPSFSCRHSLFVDSDRQRQCLTAEQSLAVDAIIKVVTGHRKRPLILSADRGRGKSSALGIAAAELMRSRRLKIAVTAPSFACASTLFTQASKRLDNKMIDHHQLEYDNSQLDFVAVDRIDIVAKDYDVVIVDEAAAIPAPILSRLVDCHNRLIFASTIHGYEGTGRGFAIKFKQVLDDKMPQWREFHLQQPIRWALQDPLEQWIFNALLLAAEAPTMTPCLDTPITVEQLPTKVLAENELLLSQLFGLLINAHYQTSPNDIQQLLDDPALSVIVAIQNQGIIGCCLIAQEGGFESGLALDIMQGKRRIKGHLLAQSIATHLGFAVAAEQQCYRILRIAVASQFQHQGIGSTLVDRVIQLAQANKIDYVGTSFGAISELVDFWHRCQFKALRLGVTKDAASGHYSLLCAQALTPKAEAWFDLALSLFGANLLAQRVEQFNQIDSELFCKLLQTSKPKSFNYGLSFQEIDHQILAYTQGALGYDLIVASLEVWLLTYIQQPNFKWHSSFSFVVEKVLLKQSWSSLVQRYQFVSRKMAEQKLRDFVISHYQSSLIKSE